PTPDAASAATSTATTTGRTRGSTTRRPTRSSRPGKIYKTSRPDLSTPAGSTSLGRRSRGENGRSCALRLGFDGRGEILPPNIGALLDRGGLGVDVASVNPGHIPPRTPRQRGVAGSRPRIGFGLPFG